LRCCKPLANHLSSHNTTRHNKTQGRHWVLVRQRHCKPPARLLQSHGSKPLTDLCSTPKHSFDVPSVSKTWSLRSSTALRRLKRLHDLRGLAAFSPPMLIVPAADTRQAPGNTATSPLRNFVALWDVAKSKPRGSNVDSPCHYAAPVLEVLNIVRALQMGPRSLQSCTVFRRCQCKGNVGIDEDEQRYRTPRLARR
jgi:hypothetical protein